MEDDGRRCFIVSLGNYIIVFNEFVPFLFATGVVSFLGVLFLLFFTNDWGLYFRIYFLDGRRYVQLQRSSSKWTERDGRDVAASLQH